ncbi:MULTISPECIES: porin [Bradyrhizobium]|uniref:Porin n=1 Tax=Bradyrhizobium aeschynomenes TaxID=2734909 RepID=A0ABX2CLS5_9BRAD|nr:MULTISPECIES: porin [Bradyrhizobium]NPU68635.1 porin [Bradyrhizobium aeschynomenes]
MKTLRGLLLGSGAVILSAVAAQAADLPLKAKAVEYVKVCSLYGTGFYYIPGTDTCIKLGGYLRAETAMWTNSNYGGAYSGVAGADNRLSNRYQTRARQDVNIDTRTATEYGVVRTYFDAVFSWTSGSAAGTGSGTGATSYTGDAISGGIVGVYYAFIQFAGFTMGKAVSTFDAPWTNYPGNNFDGLVGGSGSNNGVNQLTYTADLGQGITAAVSLEDQTQFFTTNIWNTSGITASGVLGGNYGSSAFGGTVAPDIIGMVRVDQAWGIFQASFAAHDNHAAYYGASETSGHPSDKWGWAAQLALSIKNIPTGPGDVINLQAVYTDGASRYNFQSLANTTYSMYGGTNVAGAYQSIGFAGVGDAVFGTGTGLSTVQTWGMRGAFTHNWDPRWNSALYGAYAQVRYGQTGSSLICAGIAATAMLTAGSTCNPDFNLGQIGVITRWTPVKGLTFSADVTYSHLDQKYSGAVIAPAVASTAKPAAIYQLKDQDTVSMLLRAQRNW